MANNEESESGLKKDSSVAIAVVLPAIFAIILIVLVAIMLRAFLFPRLGQREDPAAKEELKKQRLARLDSNVKAEHFMDWAAKQKKEHPGSCTRITVNPLCVICLDEIEDAAQIRGLGCLHVFHQECLDDWFARCNEYCPLCQRPIVAGTKPKKRKASDPPAVSFMV